MNVFQVEILFVVCTCGSSGLTKHYLCVKNPYVRKLVNQTFMSRSYFVKNY